VVFGGPGGEPVLGVGGRVRLHRLVGEGGVGEGGIQDRLLQTCLPVHLHRARGQPACAGVQQQARVALHQHARQVVLGGEQRGGQPHHAAADDQQGGSSWHGCSFVEVVSDGGPAVVGRPCV